MLSASLGDETWRIEGWGVEAGFSEKAIPALAQDGHGFIWCASQAGVVRFDGLRRRLFHPFGADPFDGSDVIQVLSDAQGHPWIRTEDGNCYHFENEKWRLGYDSQVAGKGAVRLISKSSQGKIMLVTDSQLVFPQETTLMAITISATVNHNELSAVHMAAQGVFWWRETNRILLQLPGKPAQERYRSALPIEASCLGNEGGLWLAVSGKLVFLSADTNMAPIEFKGGWQEAVACMTLDQISGRLWLGTLGDGAWCIDVQTSQAMKMTQAWDPLFVTDLLLADAQTIWLATAGSGLLRLIHDQTATIRLPGQAKARLTTLDRQGVFWLAMPGELWKNGKEGTSFIKLPGSWLAQPRLWLASANGPLLIGDDGLMRIGLDERPTIQSWPKELADMGPILGASLALDHSLWLGLARGVVHLSGSATQLAGQWKMTQAKRCVLADAGADGIWLLRDERLMRTDGQSDFQLINNPALQSDFWDLVLPLGQANLLALSRYAGLGQISAGSFHPLEQIPAYGSFSPISQLRVTTNGTLWCASDRGIWGLRSALIKQTGDGDLAVIEQLKTERHDEWGLGGEGEAILWWRLDDTLHFRLAESQTKQKRLTVLLDKLQLDGREVEISKQMELNIQPDTLLGVTLAVPRSLVASRVSLAYRLQGLAASWQPLTAVSDSLVIGGLPVGDYSLEARVNAGDGYWQEPNTLLKLKVRSRLGWVIPALVLVAGLMMILALGGFFLWRKKKRMTTDSAPLASEIAHDLTAAKYSTSGLSPERAEEVKILLLKRMASERPYLHANLTLRRLADQMGVHYNHLSQVINDNIGESAKDFINRYRIEEAARRIANPREHRTLMDVAYDCGFYSKSVFNAAFKKVYKMTPSEYRSKHGEK